MYTREEGFYGLPRPLRADIQLWIHLVRTCIECNYFNFIAAIEKENFLLNKSPGTLPRLLFFVSYCFLLSIFMIFLHRHFPKRQLSQAFQYNSPIFYHGFSVSFSIPNHYHKKAELDAAGFIRAEENDKRTQV